MFIVSLMPKPKDLSDQRFGLLVAREYFGKEFEKKPTRRGYWRCDCDCGKTVETPACNLLSGRAKSCGCQKGGGKLEEIGERYGMLTVVKREENLIWSGDKRRAWLCRCDCGVEIVVSGKHLRSGHAQSCGCRKAEVTRETHLLEIAGERYGRLVAVRRLPDDEQRTGSDGYAWGDWEWICDCGNKFVAPIGRVRSGATQSCGCLGLETRPLNFHNEGHRAYAEDPEYAERESIIYLVEIGGQFDKIGIAFDLQARFEKGEVSEIWWTKSLTRAQCWAVEQAALRATQDYLANEVPKDLSRGGFTEFRFGMVIEETIEMLENMCDEVKEFGWRDFYDKNVLD